MKTEQPLTRQLAPLIFFIVLIIVLTLIIRGCRATQLEYRRAANWTMRLSPFRNESRQTDPDDAAMLHIPDIETALSVASRDCENGRFARAEDQLRTALLFYPDNRALLSMLGTALYLQQKYQPAEAIFRRLTALNPDDTSAYNNLGAALAGQKKYKEALASARKVYDKEPDSAAAAINLAGMYSLDGKTAEALEYFKLAYAKLGENILPFSFSSNFDNIRQEKTFQDIVRKAEAKRRRLNAAPQGSPEQGNTP